MRIHVPKRIRLGFRQKNPFVDWREDERWFYRPWLCDVPGEVKAAWVKARYAKLTGYIKDVYGGMLKSLVTSSVLFAPSNAIGRTYKVPVLLRRKP